MASKPQPNNNYLSMGSPSSPMSNHYCSVPSSPTSANPSLGNESGVQEDENMNSISDGFEFETSKRLRYPEVDLERSQNFGYPLDDKPKEQCRRRVLRMGSLPMMAFADELFSNGIVLPLKPPPCFQREGRYLSSIASSPRSPSSVLKIQFSRHGKWDDKFDPFVVALEKVREEKRGRNRSEVPPRRTRSLSPFRGTVPQWPQDNHDELAKPKKSASSRWFSRGVKKDEPKTNLVREIMSPNHNDLTLGRRGRTVKVGLGGEITNYKENQKKMKKGFLKKYASFGKEKNEVKITEQIAALWKKSSLGKLSFKLKENYGLSSSKRRM